MTRISSLGKTLERQAARRDLLREKIEEHEAQIPELEEQINHHGEASDLLLKIGQVYRKVSVDRINNLVTMSLQGVFGRPYKYNLKLQEKRGQVEMEQSVDYEGMNLDPEYSMGGGIVDVISFSLRQVIWGMAKERTDSVMVLDEPFRCVSSDHIDAAASLLKRVSEKMGIQFLVVTHEEALAASADKTFKATIKDGETRLECQD